MLGRSSTRNSSIFWPSRGNDSYDKPGTYTVPGLSYV
ncbi:MAG: hypothetical protein HUJ99_07685 [Bacteroidaceae bacterium]|nr:hypothetical protein [Bacteroidaceae bacterium]